MPIDELKVQLGLNGRCGHKSSVSSTHLLFFPIVQHDSDSAYSFHSPSHSHLLVEPKPSCPSSFSAM